MLLHDARRDARVGPDGELVLLEDQDRSRWDQARIAEGQRAHRAGAGGSAAPGPYQVQAAIAAAPRRGGRPPADTDWAQIAALYGTLQRMTPSPVVELNLAVAVAMPDGPAVGLAMIDGLAAYGRLDDYAYLHAARADLLRRLERWSEAAAGMSGRPRSPRTPRNGAFWRVVLPRSPGRQQAQVGGFTRAGTHWSGPFRRCPPLLDSRPRVPSTVRPGLRVDASATRAERGSAHVLRRDRAIRRVPDPAGEA